MSDVPSRPANAEIWRAESIGAQWQTVSCECKGLATLAVGETRASDADVCSLALHGGAWVPELRQRQARRGLEKQREAHLILQDDPQWKARWAAVDCGRDEGGGRR